MAFSNETAPNMLKVVEHFLPEEYVVLAYHEPDEYQKGLMRSNELARRAFARGWQVWIDDLDVVSLGGAKIYTKIFDLKSLFDVLRRKGIERQTVHALIESDGLLD